MARPSESKMLEIIVEQGPMTFGKAAQAYREAEVEPKSRDPKGLAVRLVQKGSVVFNSQGLLSVSAPSQAVE